MLTPEYLDRLTDDILGMYDALNESIVRDIARRIVKTGKVTETAAWQMRQAQEMGALYDDTIERIAEISRYTENELQRLFEDAGVENIRYENDIMSQKGLMPIELKQSERMLKLLRAGIDKTSRDLSNLTLTTAIRAQNAYYNATNLAYLQVSSGVLSHQEAVKRAVLSTAKEGVTVLYPSGHVDKVDVAVRRAVLTGVNQTAAKMSLEYCDESGCDFVETTAHSGARPSHEVWQGRVFCRSGKSKLYPPFSETGYGTGAGLCGWNCRHSFHAFWPGISSPAYTQEMLADYRVKKYEYGGEKLTDYECSQRQRGYERKIRETKRQLSACDAAMKEADEAEMELLQKEFEEKSVRLKSIEAELKDFCKKTKRPVVSARMQVHAVRDKNGRIVGFGRTVSQKARNSAEKHYQKWKKEIGADAGPKNLAGYYKIKYNNSKEARLYQGYIKAVKKGGISPLVGYDKFKEIHENAERVLIGKKLPDGQEIKGITAHFTERVIGQQAADDIPKSGMRKGVSLSDIQDTVQNGKVYPVITDKSGRKSQRIIGKKCSITYNPDTGELIQTEPRSR